MDIWAFLNLVTTQYSSVCFFCFRGFSVTLMWPSPRLENTMLVVSSVTFSWPSFSPWPCLQILVVIKNLRLCLRLWVQSCDRVPVKCSFELFVSLSNKGHFGAISFCRCATLIRL